jgi:hypothetical protein
MFGNNARDREVAESAPAKLPRAPVWAASHCATPSARQKRRLDAWPLDEHGHVPQPRHDIEGNPAVRVQQAAELATIQHSIGRQNGAAVGDQEHAAIHGAGVEQDVSFGNEKFDTWRRFSAYQRL